MGIDVPASDRDDEVDEDGNEDIEDVDDNDADANDVVVEDEDDRGSA